MGLCSSLMVCLDTAIVLRFRIAAGLPHVLFTMIEMIDGRGAQQRWHYMLEERCLASTLCSIYHFFNIAGRRFSGAFSVTEGQFMVAANF